MSLNNGNGFDIASDTITDKALLKSKIANLRNTITIVEQEIEEIKSDESFEIINEIEDWDEYFENIKEQLQEELDNLTQNNIE